MFIRESPIILTKEELKSLQKQHSEKIRKIPNLISLILRRMRFLKRKKKLTRRLRRWRHFAKSKKTRDVKEKPRIKKLLKQNKPKLKKRWIWTLLPNTFRENGTGSKPKVNSSPRREREVRKERRERKSDHGQFTQVLT